MQKKMLRFFNSIGFADEASLFDMDFASIKMDLKNPKQVNMTIKKDSPWRYDLLEKFVMALGNVSYPYSLEFEYPSINDEDVSSLLKGYLSVSYFGISDPIYEIKDGSLVFIASNDDKEIKELATSFSSLLEFVSYPYKVEVRNENKQKEENPVVIKEEIQVNEENNYMEESSKEVVAEEPAAETKEIKEEVKEEPKKEMDEGEAALIEEMDRNLAKMKEEREFQRTWKKGDYHPYDNLDDLFRAPLCNVDVVGTIFEGSSRMTKTSKISATLGIYDSSNAINVKAWESKSLKAEELTKYAEKGIGTRIRVRGALMIDKFTSSKVINAHYIDVLPPAELRTDPYPEKRVELHLHTNLSNMDAVCTMDKYCATAKSMGMDAIAVTDHGVVQAFPAAQAAAKKYGLKMIYGSELYMVDLRQKYIFNPANIPLKSARYCVFDTETTGLSARYDKIIEIGGIIVENGRVVDRLNQYIDPEMHISDDSTRVHHITDDMVKGKPTIEEFLPKILEFFGDCILVAHNATFDVGFINAALERAGKPPLANPIIDTIPISHYLFPEAGRHSEGAMLRNLGLKIYNEEDAHEAVYDATALNEGWQEIILRLDKEHPGITHADLDSLNIELPPKEDKDKPDYQARLNKFRAYVRHLHSYHCIALAKNQQGLKDLYRIITEGHVSYFAGVPRTPRELITKYRENLLIGSACFNSEIFEMASTRDISVLADAMKFYDYIEIQPIENYSYLLDMGRVASKEHLVSLLKDIVAAAKIANKPVVATGDCHYLDKEDKILRDIYIYAKAIGGGAHPLNPPARANKPLFENPDQHFRSTQEMIDSFKTWMDIEEAKKIIVDNSRMIASQIEQCIPVSDDLFAPNENLPHSDLKIRELCESNFKARYCGNTNPEVIKRIGEVKARLDKELNGIIDNGYAVTYYIAHCLIKMANDEPEHYIVGSRGSVGSSFAATMADITEVNALPPHYLCPHCHYFEWADPIKYKSGFDLPDKVCPECGGKMKQDGQNIPFETFLGFSADKVPDIDLNFEDESQHKAHNYTKILLGENNVFRAGTIETVAEKTAYGFVRGYFERIGKNPDSINPAYIASIASRCQGVKRTTGQHPGGIVVVPSNMSIFDFTAVQHPADDLESEWLTTHYDFRSMHDEILKLDILGHVDPMAMRYYRDLTGVKIEDIPMNDPKVLSLFVSPDALKLHSNYLGLKTGASALPEFGTDLAQRMLMESNPKTFNDLLIISGLAHGTNVWSGNAEDLILNGVTDLNGVIGCRDDIMTYLISMGVPSNMSFKIMEDVRKGRGLKPEYEAKMVEQKVPQYYIESCKKIKYLFPRGHATAYVMMAVRVAYFKLYYPLEFYAVFFSVRSDDYDIKSMIEGEDAIKAKIEELRARMDDRSNPLKNKEINIYKTLLIALEMVERGYKFENIDLYKSDAQMFVVDHENKALIPPFSVVDGLGLAAAQSIVDARSDGRKFLSKEDILKRANKLNSTNLNDLEKLGVLKGLGETNQMSLFEFF